MRRISLLTSWLLVACAGAPSATAVGARSSDGPRVDRTAERARAPGTATDVGDPGTSGAGTPTSSPLLTCPLAVDARAIGEPGDGAPSAPVVLGDGGFAVAFTRTTAAGTALLVQRIRGDGTLDAPVTLRDGVHASRPFAIGDGTRAYVLAITQSGATEAIALDPTSGGPSGAPPLSLPQPPEDVALGPRGLVATSRTDDHRLVHRAGQPDVRLPPARSYSMPREQVVASGPEADLVVVRRGRAVSTAAIEGGSTSRGAVLFRGGDERWAEAGVAAGPGGFALVRTGPEIGELEVYLADRHGAFGASVPVPPPASPSRPPDALVRRYPRAVAVQQGWAISYWDGTGPSLVRVDAAGQVTADAIELRSGDERGGHTDARMVATGDAIAVTWQVEPPRMSHGFAEEEPRRPGPRLAILRCVE